MNVKKNAEPTQQKVRVRIRLGTKILWITLLLLAATAEQAIAEIKKGIITAVEVGGYRSRRLEIRVDTDGNRMPDHVLTFPDPAWGWARDLQNFAEKGMEIVFDNNGGEVSPAGNVFVNGDNTISIDGSNMVDLFPAEKDRFKFAVAAKTQTQQQTTPPATTSKDAELEALRRRLAELEGGR